MSSGGGNINKRFWNANLSISMLATTFQCCFCTNRWNESLHLEQSHAFICFSHTLKDDVLIGLDVLMEKVNCFNIWLKGSFFEQIRWQVAFSDRSTIDVDKIVHRNYYAQSHGDFNTFPAVLHKIPTQTIDLFPILKREFCRSRSKYFRKMKISLNKKTIKELKQVFPLNLTNYSTDFCHQTPFDLEKKLSFRSII